MKRFLTTTAFALTLGTAAIAQSGTYDWTAPVEHGADQFYGSDLIGMRIYRAEQDYTTGDTIADGTETEWDDIGEINDLVITADGNVQSVILGIGGFLGIGERDVAIKMDAIRILTDQDDPDDRFLVVSASKSDLETVPAYERHSMGENAMDGSTDMTNDTDAAATMDNATMDNAMRPNMEREGYATVEMVSATSLEGLEGAPVYDVNENHIGEISHLLVDGDTLTDAVIDVGGFLGMGEKPVSLSFEQLQVLQNADGGDLRVYVDMSEEQLEALPEFEG
ncbi:PRC-barrel domain-containing protein [Rhodobacteraceae bacterium KMM 6894]|nr:PRC-barrel domain-containing protein [Rhodobacteraceae bacterium KMM 6894]